MGVLQKPTAGSRLATSEAALMRVVYQLDKRLAMMRAEQPP